MSSKCSLFLTSDDEHCFSDCNEPCVDKNGKYIGDTIYLEMSKKNIDIYENDEENLVISIKAGSELYEKISRMKD